MVQGLTGSASAAKGLRRISLQTSQARSGGDAQTYSDLRILVSGTLEDPVFKSVDIGVHPCGVCHALEQANMRQDASRVQRSSVAEIVSSKGSDSKKAQEAKEILELFPCSPGNIDPRRVEQTSPRPTLQKKHRSYYGHATAAINWKGTTPTAE